MATTSDGHEFRISITGIDLDRETIDRINKAVQQTVLAEFGKLDFVGKVGVEFPRPPFLGLIFKLLESAD